MAVTTAPEATADTTRGGPPPTRMQLARGAGVVTAGPLLLALGSLVAPVAAVRRWPDRVHRDRTRRAAWALTGAGLAWPWLYGAVVLPWLRTWGSTGPERRRPWPGDPQTKPFSTNTRAVTVHAPAEEVWRWLVQMAWGRAGWYTARWVDRLLFP